jgi:outer membrane lipoprotein-sorting protein
MTSTTSSRSLRRRAAWSAPVLTAAVVGGAALLPSAASADAHPNLPAKTAAELLAAVQTSTVTALSGTIVETARLGLPSLPGSDSSAALTWQTLVTGTHSARVWLDGADKQRLALLGQLAESDLVHNGSDLWSYASDTQQVGHMVLPADPATKGTATKAPDLTTYTPQGAAAAALKAIDPSTAVTVDRTARVAGQPAYTLVLTPRDSRSTVRQVKISIDAAHNVPLRVQVYGAGSAPAFETGFTDISFRRPAASVFAFTPPAGAKVSNDLLPLMSQQATAEGTDKVTGKATTPGTSGASPTVVGSGWTSVLVLPAAKDGSSPLAGLTGSGGTGPDSASSVIGHLTTALPNGDRVLRTALVNVLMTRDGRTLVGAVSTALLEQAAAGQLG